MKSCCASSSSASILAPNEWAGIVPSQRKRSASAPGSSGNVSPVSVKMNSFRSIRPFGWRRGASSELCLWVGINRRCGAVGGPALQKSFAACDAWLAERNATLRDRRSICPSLGSEFAQGVVLPADPLEIEEQVPFVGARLLVALRSGDNSSSKLLDERSRAPAAAKTR